MFSYISLMHKHLMWKMYSLNVIWSLEFFSPLLRGKTVWGGENFSNWSGFFVGFLLLFLFLQKWELTLYHTNVYYIYSIDTQIDRQIYKEHGVERWGGLSLSTWVSLFVPPNGGYLFTYLSSNFLIPFTSSSIVLWLTRILTYIAFSCYLF